MNTDKHPERRQHNAEQKQHTKNNGMNIKIKGERNHEHRKGVARGEGFTLGFFIVKRGDVELLIGTRQIELGSYNRKNKNRNKRHQCRLYHIGTVKKKSGEYKKRII